MEILVELASYESLVPGFKRSALLHHSAITFSLSYVVLILLFVCLCLFVCLICSISMVMMMMMMMMDVDAMDADV